MDATVLAFAKQGAVVYTSDDGEPPRLSPDPEPVATHTLAEVEKDYILRVLQQTSGVIEGQNGAAKILDLHPNTLRSRMKNCRSNEQATIFRSLDHDVSFPRYFVAIFMGLCGLPTKLRGLLLYASLDERSLYPGPMQTIDDRGEEGMSC